VKEELRFCPFSDLLTVIPVPAPEFLLVRLILLPISTSPSNEIGELPSID
jgi:hypothetical protein